MCALFTDTLYFRAFLTSLVNAGIATILCLLIGYPMALGLTRVSKSWRNILLMLVILPFWTSFLLRVYAWMGLMGKISWFNAGADRRSGTAIVPADWAVDFMPMMHSNFAVVLVMVYTYLPFMILPLYASLERLDPTLDEAALDLGSRPWQVFLDVTLPQSIPGIVAGGMLVFIPAAGELVIPTLVGDAASPMIGRVISDQFSSARDWPMASAIAVVLLVLMVVPAMIYSHLPGQGGGHEVKRRPTFLLSHAGLRLCLLLHPDPVDDRLFLQRVAAGERLGRLLDEMVCLAVLQQAGDRRADAVAGDRAGLRHDGDDPRHHGGNRAGALHEVPRAACCSPAWSPRR